MKTVGHRIEPPLAKAPSGERLMECARVMEALRAFPGGDVAFIPKGVYRFMTLEDADRHWEVCLAEAMARLARKRA
jgi:hypothetical protein